MARLDGTGKTKSSQRTTRFSAILQQKKPVDAEEVSEATNEVESAKPDVVTDSTPPVESAEPSPAQTPTIAQSEPVHADIPQPNTEPKRRGRKATTDAKRSNPNYGQALFWIRNDTSNAIDRAILDLRDSGETIDRSDFAQELFENFFRLSKEVGTVEAMKQLRIK